MNNASTYILNDKVFRERHRRAVTAEKEKRGGKQAYDARRKNKLKQIQKEDDVLMQVRKERLRKEKEEQRKAIEE